MQIQDIKQNLTLSNILNYYHLKPDKNLRLNCPFHNDKTPSLQVYYKTHTCYCFSSNCKTHGKSLDVIDFIMFKENITKHQALLKAQEIINHYQTKTTHQTIIAPTTAATLTIARETFLQNMFTYFKNAVSNSKPAQEYIKSRCLWNLCIAPLGDGGIGYNTAQFHHGQRRDKTLINNCVAVGLLTPWGVNNRKPEEQAYKAFGKECIVFALKNKSNNITGLYFRSTTNNDNQKHYYLKESTGLYPSYPKQETQKLIITESIIDAASLLQIEAITKQFTILAAYGTNRLNEEHKQAIIEWSKVPPSKEGFREVVFAFDNDEAGNTASAKYAAQLITHNSSLIITTLTLPNKDVNETLQTHNQEIFLHLLEQRTNVFLSSESTIETPNEQPKLLIQEAATTINTTTQPTTHHQQNNNTQPQTPNNFNTTNPNKITYTTATATYYILGGIPKQLDSLKIMLSVENTTGFKSRNKIDLYEDKLVEKLCKEVAEKLQLSQNKVEQELYTLTERLEQYREQQQAETLTNNDTQPTTYFTAAEKIILEQFLQAPKVIKRLNELLSKTGIVGEERNRIFLLLIALSYKMKDPLHALIQGSSGSGKTKLVRQISDCIPQENVTRFTRISDKALYNYPKNYFSNRLLIIEDVDGLSEDAEMAFRELQSSGELRSSISIKLDNGNITGGEKIVSGPIASMSCTTKGEIYEDNMSRVFLIAVDESNDQTKRIIQYQNELAAGKIDKKEQQKTATFIQNLIRVLAVKEVINPFAEKIQLPEEAHKIRRLNDLFQNFIKMVTLVNQYQRQTTTQQKLLAQIEDVEMAIEIMFESIVLKVDELDGSLRQFYEKLKTYLQKTYKDTYATTEFTQREIRQALHISKAQCSRYFMQLVSLEYITIRNQNNLRKIQYKIDYWDSYTALRESIKNKLKQQINQLKGNNMEQ